MEALKSFVDRVEIDYPFSIDKKELDTYADKLSTDELTTCQE